MMKLINKFMLQGKKFRIEKIILIGFYELRHSYVDIQPFFILFRYLILYRPMFGFNKIRLSRLFKTIPVPLSSKRQMILILT
jgi:ribosomal protein S7